MFTSGSEGVEGGFEGICAESPTTHELVQQAFSTILGYHELSDEVVEAHLRFFPRFDTLCKWLKSSKEFGLGSGGRAGPGAGLDTEEARLRTIVRSLYRAYLCREPDLAGLEDSVTLLRRMDGLAGVGQLATIFEQSTERALRDHLSTCVRWITTNVGEPNEFGTAPVISLGSHCAPAMILKKNDLKQFSTPFDWIFSTPAMVRECLEDDFVTLLNPRHHRAVTRLGPDGRSITVSEHTLYNKRFAIAGPIFNHRDVTRPGVLDYYRRCAARLRQVLQHGQRAYLVQCVVADMFTPEQCAQEFQATAALLDRMAPRSSLAMFLIRWNGGIMPEIRALHEHGPHRLFQLNTVSMLETLDFREKIDHIALLRALRWHARTAHAAAG